MQYHKNAKFQKKIARKLVEIAGNFANFNNKKIADIGCGSGFVAEKLIEIGVLQENILQFDQNPEKLSFASQFSPIKMWNFNTPYPFGEKFDVIFSSMALQWAKDFNASISNIEKMLAVGENFFFAVPVNNSLDSLYKILNYNYMHFLKEEAINAKILEKIEFRQNAYEALKSMHELGLKVENGRKITKEMVKKLKSTETVWEVGVFVR